MGLLAHSTDTVANSRYRAALMQWSHLPPEATAPGPREARPVFRQLLIGGAAAGTLAAFGHRTAAAVVAGLVLAITVSSALSPRVARFLQSCAAWLERWVGRGLTVVLLSASYLLVVTPLSFLLRSLGSRPLVLHADAGRSTYWERVTRHPRWELHRRQFTYEAPERTGGGWLSRMLGVLGVLGVLMAVDLSLGMRSKDSVDDWMRAVPGQAWIAEFNEEHNAMAMRWQPYVEFRCAPMKGKHINVTENGRRSYMPASSTRPDAVRVFFFGGSTMWGWWDRDDNTIPSIVARLAEERGIPVVPSNYGEPGWATSQEVRLLSELTSTGTVPDLAVFYDGFNEVNVQMSLHLNESHIPPLDYLPELRRWFDRHDDPFDTYRKRSAFFKDVWDPAMTVQPHWGQPVEQPAPPPAAYADVVVKWYTSNIRHAGKLGSAYGFPVVAFWQPWLYSKAALHEDEPKRGELNYLGDVWKAATARVVPPAIDVTDALNGTTERLMEDNIHTNEAGTRLIAERLFRELEPSLREVHARKQAGGPGR
jgi:lysophospholipase L1-like esterase